MAPTVRICICLSDVEKRYVEVVASVREQVSVPLAVKIGPYFSSTAHVATQLVEAGADGLVLFNRFYQPDIDLEELTVVPNLKLSHSDELRLPLRWTAILANVVDCDLAVTSGVHTAADALKAVIVGADVVMMASAVLHHGAKRVTDVLLEMHAWLAEHDYESLAQLRGSMTLDSAPDAAAFVRANYLQVLASYTPTRHR